MVSKKYSRIKGRNYEKQIAKIIHEFLLDNVEEYRNLIEEVDDSIGVKNDITSGVSTTSRGDIDLGIGIKYFPFAIECKKREDLVINLKTIFNLEKSKIYTIYKKQAKNKAKQHNINPLVIFSKKYTDNYVFFNIDDIKEISLEDIKELDHIYNNGFVIMKLDDFLGVWKRCYLKKLR
jgi:hypothetical protein